MALVFWLAGCKSDTIDLIPAKVPADKVAAVVNGEPLSLDEFDNEFRLMAIHYSAVTEGNMRTIKRQLFEQVIDRRLLVQQARLEGIGVTRSEWNDALKDALKEGSEDFPRLLKVQGVSEDSWKRKLFQEVLARKIVDLEVNRKVFISPHEVEEYYWSHLEDYWRPEAVHALHLVVRQKAGLKKALDRLAKGESFSSVASYLSEGLEKSKGGDWGFLSLDRLSGVYIKALRALKPGQVSPPLKDELGYHLFQLVEWRPRQMQEFEMVRQQIQTALVKEEQDLRFDEWMTGIKRRAVVRVNPDLAPVVGAASKEDFKIHSKKLPGKKGRKGNKRKKAVSNR